MSITANHSHDVDASPEERMRALVEVISSYIEQYHGGWVHLVSYDGDVLKVKMGGACEGCHLSEGTLRGWVEGSVRQFFPDIKSVEAV
ncbi:MAG: NifU family protein [Anaerolineales bacterium]|nr:NifU family protein [Anaerolineales bacterium]